MADSDQSKGHENQFHLIDLRMIQSGSEQCGPGYAFGPARRDHYLFHYVLSGNGTLYAKDQRGEARSYDIAAGQGFMIYPDDTNTYVADTSDPWKYIWVEFDGLCVKPTLAKTELSKNTPVYRPRSLDLKNNMVEEMRYITAHSETGSLNVTGHLYLFLDYLLQSAKADRLRRPRGMRDFYVGTAIRFIEDHFQERLRIDEIASVCGIDRAYFGKIFHEAVGMSPQAFIMDYRMHRAEALLRETNMPIGEIAVAIGYENPLHFSRAFKNARGVSPRAWRESQR